MDEYLKFLDTERTGRLTTQKLVNALTALSRMPPPDHLVRMLWEVKQEKMRKQEEERKRKKRAFMNKLIIMRNAGVTDVLRKFERFMRDRGERVRTRKPSLLAVPPEKLDAISTFCGPFGPPGMRLQDFFNLVDEDRSGRLTPQELMQVRDSHGFAVESRRESES